MGVEPSTTASARRLQRLQDSAEFHQTVCVCVPTYNEAGNVERFVQAVLGTFDAVGVSGTVLVIDDASPDGTGEIAGALARLDPRVQVLHRASKDGIGRAYQAGFAWALAHGFDLVAQMDCDFSHDPAALPLLLAAARNADLVLGSRYVPGGRVCDWSLPRRLISRGGSAYARTILGLAVRDLTGGFKCFRREALVRLPFRLAEARGYGFQIEMTYRALQAGMAVVEVPIVFRDRTRGKSKMSAGIALEAARLVLKLRLARRPRPRLEAPVYNRRTPPGEPVG
jgi:dolichol-phosphate mannosyltransferase